MEILFNELIRLQEELLKEDAYIKLLDGAVAKANDYKGKFEFDGKINFYDLESMLQEHISKRNDIEDKMEYIKDLMGIETINPRGTDEYNKISKYIDDKMGKFGILIHDGHIKKKWVINWRGKPLLFLERKSLLFTFNRYQKQLFSI